MRYVKSHYKQQVRDDTYRIFITDELYYLNNNVVNLTGGSKLNKRYIDILYPPQEVVEPERKSQEIIDNLKSKMRKL